MNYLIANLIIEQWNLRPVKWQTADEIALTLT